jgi:hypothetical protein
MSIITTGNLNPKPPVEVIHLYEIDQAEAEAIRKEIFSGKEFYVTAENENQLLRALVFDAASVLTSIGRIHD